ncbi:unnamed protein product, partial [Ectocarpus sp. 4 AP-2014]
ADYFRSKLEFETDSWDLNRALNAGEPIVVIDARSRDAFDAEHLPNAISLPHGEMNAETTAGFNRESLYVIYCDGIGCNASTKGALRMTELGFYAKELLGGIDWWKRDGYPTQLAVIEITT